MIEEIRKIINEITIEAHGYEFKLGRLYLLVNTYHVEDIKDTINLIVKERE